VKNPESVSADGEKLLIRKKGLGALKGPSKEKKLLPLGCGKADRLYALKEEEGCEIGGGGAKRG